MTGQTQPVECGICPKCRKTRTSGWSFRLMQQDKEAKSSYFVTLTYDTDSLPFSKNGFPNLNPDHLRVFFKKLRKRHPDTSNIKYYAVGEYGESKRRPHYHIILFNSDLPQLVGKIDAQHVQNNRKTLDGKSPFYSTSWEHGHITLGTVSGASVGYTLKYISKRWFPMHRNDDRCPQFSRMSKGLGANYLTPQMLSWHYQDLENRMYCNLQDGKKCSMPRYYKDKIYGTKTYFDEESLCKITNPVRKILSTHHKQKAQDELTKKILNGGETHFRDTAERDKAAFAKMDYKTSQIRESL